MRRDRLLPLSGKGSGRRRVARCWKRRLSQLSAALSVLYKNCRVSAAGHAEVPTAAVPPPFGLAIGRCFQWGRECLGGRPYIETGEATKWSGQPASGA